MNVCRCAACTLLAGAITLDAVGHRFDHPHTHVPAPSENANFFISTAASTMSSSARSAMTQGSSHATHLR